MHNLSIFLALSSLAVGQQFTVPTPPKGVQPNAIPRIGMGTARMTGNTSEAIAKAIENGVRHFDCAYIYGNQKDIGIGLKEGLRRTGISRQELWITSKLWNDRYGGEIFIRNLDQDEANWIQTFPG
jgi:alcohol dehydrogenase (NADP+)